MTNITTIIKTIAHKTIKFIANAVKFTLIAVFFMLFIYFAVDTGLVGSFMGAVLDVEEASVPKIRKIAETIAVEEATISICDVQRELKAIGELCTYEDTYSGSASYSEGKMFFDWFAVPFTTHSIEVSYKGVIKAGVCVDNIDVVLEGETIIVTMPEAYIISNSIDFDSVVCKDDNTIFNAIESEEVVELLSVIEDEEEEAMIEEGILDDAVDNAEEICLRALSDFIEEGYTVEFR